MNYLPFLNQLQITCKVKTVNVYKPEFREDNWDYREDCPDCNHDGWDAYDENCWTCGGAGFVSKEFAMILFHARTHRGATFIQYPHPTYGNCTNPIFIREK